MHATPVAVQEVREAYADAVVGGDKMIIGSGRALRLKRRDRRSSSAPNYASGTHPSLSFSSGESNRRCSPHQAGTEISWNPDGEAKLIQPKTFDEVQPASESSSKAKSVFMGPRALEGGAIAIRRGFSEMLPPEIKPLPLPPGR